MQENRFEYEEMNGDEQIFHMWEPLNFELTDDYEYIVNDPIFNFFSDLIFYIITPILWIFNKLMFGFEIEGI